MQGNAQPVHKPGPFKQQNKSHKTGRHRSKGAVEAEHRGRVAGTDNLRKTKVALSRKDRRNQLVQLRKNKRLNTFDERREFDGAEAPPFLVAVISLTLDVEPANFVHELSTFSEDCRASVNEQNTVTHVCADRLKKRFSFVPMITSNVYQLLDVLRLVDSTVFLWPTDGRITSENEQLLSLLTRQGIPTAVHVVKGFKTLSVKRKDECRQTLSHYLEKWFQNTKFHCADSDSDLHVFLRNLSEIRRKRIGVQQLRSYMLVEKFEMKGQADVNPNTSTLEIYGYVRGRSVDVNGLVEIVGCGVFQIDKIEILSDKLPVCGNRKHSNMEQSVVLSSSTDLQAKLQSEAVPESLDMEQALTDSVSGSVTVVANGELKKITRKVPKGTSEYQAAWIVDEGDASASADSESEDDDENMEAAVDYEEEDYEESDQEEVSNADEMDVETMSNACTQPDSERTDEAVDAHALEEFRRARENQMFPDEVDTPIEVAARTRFQKYRGLKSFRTSPWDHRENLPFDYARIFQFENFRSTKKRLLAEKRAENEAHAGSYVCVYVSNVPKHFIVSLSPDAQLTAFYLLPHEQKMSVLNMVIKRESTCTIPIKSKENLIFQVGFRRFSAAPIFSQHTNGDKHKYERYLPDVGSCVATVFAPILFPPAPVLVFRKTTLGDLQLVASGAVLDFNANRTVIKRTVLSGHPFKINRKAAVVRFMFFNREDILWFKPVELTTKYGRKGHIKEPLGTHGHMKCTFDGQLNSQDTVLMKLYKRVFPKWTYDPCCHH